MAYKIFFAIQEHLCVRIPVLMAVKIRAAVFWVIIISSLVGQ